MMAGGKARSGKAVVLYTWIKPRALIGARGAMGEPDWMWEPCIGRQGQGKLGNMYTPYAPPLLLALFKTVQNYIYILNYDRLKLIGQGDVGGGGGMDCILYSPLSCQISGLSVKPKHCFIGFADIESLPKLNETVSANLQL